MPFVITLFERVVCHVAFLLTEESAEEGDRGHGLQGWVAGWEGAIGGWESGAEGCEVGD